MVGARQKRNWGPIQFEKVKDGNIVEAGKSFSDLAADGRIHNGPKFKGIELPDEDTVEKYVPEKSHEWVEKRLESEKEKSVAIEPEVVDATAVDDSLETKIYDEHQNFTPSKRQIRAKLRFHKYCPPTVILKLDPRSPTVMLPTGLHAIEYIGQMDETEFAQWTHLPNFWPWFITDDDVDADIYEAKKKASELLLDVLKMDDINVDTGLPDLKILNLKLRVAESIMNKNKTIKVENKTVNVKNMFNGVPKRMAKADTVTLEQRLAQLKENNGD